jgi:hypothetical protein
MLVEANPRKTHGVRDLGKVELGSAREAICNLDEAVWQLHDTGKPLLKQRTPDAQHVIFRFVKDPQDWRESEDWPLWAEWRPMIEPLLQQASAAYGYTRRLFPRILLARLQPGGAIGEHRDAKPAARWPHKIHIPIQTNPLAELQINGETHRLEVGRAYEVDNLGLHSAANRGSTARIHLIFECYDPDQPVLTRPD